MSDLRKEAKGRDCTIRLPGVCNFNPETSVLAHKRMAGITGMSQKAPDVLGAIACSACHDVVDGRVKTDFEREFVELAFFEGMARTLYQWAKEGLVRW